jgi:hypothetical protein
MSSGTVTAFGSVFVNGHEFNIASAKLIDDDDPGSTLAASSLEVGMSVDVKAAGDSSEAHPSAAELHLHPLVRGYVDDSSTTGTLTVMGQTVQLTAATNFSDHRTCLTAATTPCTAVISQGTLVQTGGSTPGNYVTVHGYLFNAGSGGTNVVATLVSVGDAPATARPAAFKVEGPATAASGPAVTIGALNVDLSKAKCFVSGAQKDCNGAFSVGQVVSAVGAAAPTLSGSALIFAADAARLRNPLLVQAAGAPVEVEGKVFSVTTSPAAGFVVRGINVDAQALTSGSLPAVGDVVEVTGTVASDGRSVTASTVKVLHSAHAATYAFEGDVAASGVAGSAPAYTLTLLGESISVNASTRLADRSLRNGNSAQTSNPLNITTFATYLGASTSKHLLVRTQADGTGALTALSVTILPASAVSSVSGVVDASPVPTSGKPTTFSVHGVPVSADPGAILGAKDFMGRGSPKTSVTPVTVAAGDLVLARGTLTSGVINVAPTLSMTNLVVDLGVPRGDDHDGF